MATDGFTQTHSPSSPTLFGMPRLFRMSISDRFDGICSGREGRCIPWHPGRGIVIRAHRATEIRGEQLTAPIGPIGMVPQRWAQVDPPKPHHKLVPKQSDAQSINISKRGFVSSDRRTTAPTHESKPTSDTHIQRRRSMSATRQLTEIIERIHLLPDVLAGIVGISGVSYDPVANRTSLSLEGPTERAVDKLEGVQGVLTPLVNVLHDWSAILCETVTRQTEDNVALWLLRHCEWAEKHYADWEDSQREIERVHRKISAMTGYGVDRNDRKCPHCQVFIERPMTSEGCRELWNCPMCHREWLITRDRDELQEEQRKVLATQHVSVSVAEASTITNVPRQTIHTWIRRGKLTNNKEKVYLDEVRKLCLNTR